jgi:hypothetical protein
VIVFDIETGPQPTNVLLAKLPPFDGSSAVTARYSRKGVFDALAATIHFFTAFHFHVQFS